MEELCIPNNRMFFFMFFFFAVSGIELTRCVHGSWGTPKTPSFKYIKHFYLTMLVLFIKIYRVRIIIVSSSVHGVSIQ